MEKSPLQLYNESYLSFHRISYTSGVYYETLRGWILFGVKPRKVNQKIFEAILRALKETPLPEYNPAYGHATPEQIRRLNEIGICPEYDEIIKQIEFQNTKAAKLHTLIDNEDRQGKLL